MLSAHCSKVDIAPGVTGSDAPFPGSSKKIDQPTERYRRLDPTLEGTVAPEWCPGQRKDPPTGPDEVVWDWNVCHTFYFTNYGMGNVVTSYDGTNAPVWDGDNPPPDAITRRQCPPIAFMCP